MPVVVVARTTTTTGTDRVDFQMLTEDEDVNMPRQLDVAIRHGSVIDGSGTSAYAADIGICGDTIALIGDVPEAVTEVDASGLVVCPGFVDPHSHTDWTLHANRAAESTIRQGVTTEVVGNCGISNAPVTDRSLPSVRERMAAYGYAGPVGWRSFGDYLRDVEHGGIAQNLAFFVGHSTLREAIGVTGRRVRDEDVDAMGDLVRDAMEAGALGLSSGLEYSLGATAETAELQRLVNVVGRYGGIYASHIRNRDARILEAVDEFLTLVRSGNAAGQISHLNVRDDTGAPDRAWERAVTMMTDARLTGLDVQADITPFRQGLGVMTGLLPEWLLADGYAVAVERLSDRSVRSRLRHECDRYWRFVHKGQWQRVRLLNSAQLPEMNGLTLTEIARRRRQDPWDAYFDILAAAGEGMGNLIMVGDLFTDDHLAEAIAHPLFSLGVDAYSSIDHGPLSTITASPLPYKGHIEYLTHHVRETATLSLEQAVHKMSCMPARRFGLNGRGLIREGYFADLVVFDFDNLHSASTFANPAVYPEGVSHVLVNGTVAVDHGRRASRLTGRVLRRTR